ncbi:hypothetical protein LCGC14_2151800, partial [marine sediment metagenome]
VLNTLFRMEFLRLLKLSLVILFVLNVPAKALGTEAKLIMATFELVPYGFESEDGQNQGVLFDMMNSIIAKSGIEAEHYLVPCVSRKHLMQVQPHKPL